MRFIHNFLRKIESTPIGLMAGTATFLAIIFIRNQLELLLEQDHNITISLSTATVLADYIHVVMAWSYIYLMSVIILATVGRCSWVGANRVSLCGLMLIWVPPLLDGLFGHSGAIVYQYSFDSFFSSFTHLFLPWVDVNYVTLGVRVEIFLVMLATLLYVGMCSHSQLRWWRAGLCGFLIYCAIFTMGYLPAFISFLTGMSHSELLQQSVLGVTATNAPILWYLPMILILGMWHLAETQTRLWCVLKSCVRIERMLIYVLFTLAGVMQGIDNALLSGDWLNVYDILLLSLALLSVAIAFIAMTALNDIHDIQIDVLSNPSRPLVADPSLIDEYRCIAFVGSMIGIGVSFGYNISQPILLISMLSLGCLYSVPPFRLRRYLFVAPIVLTAIVMVCYLFGMAMVWNNSTPEQLNLPELCSLALLFFIACQFKDLKDVEGDRANGVATLAVYLGAQRTYWVLGTLLLIELAVLVSVGFLSLSAPSIMAGCLFLLTWIVFKNNEWLISALVVCLGILLLK
ncbi:hypothetical protein GCM10009347_36420 [Shewanella algicola]|nr:hypothetical protein GCM10009347_36420 [Shewanella algicola]